MKKIQIPTRDGKKLAANLYEPLEPTNKLAILCPGYLHSKDYEHIVTLSEALIERGFTAVSFDPTGTWETGGDISEYTISKYIENVKSVLDYMIESGGFTYVLLGGHSRGGGISIQVAAEDNRISKVIGIMISPQKPLSKERIEQWENKGFESSFQSIPGKFEKKEFEVPFSYVEDRNSHTIDDAAMNVRVPTVLFWGGSDKHVSFNDSNNIYKILGGIKNIVQIPYAHHTYWDNPDTLKAVNEVILKYI